jgi:hypothetical protein
MSVLAHAPCSQGNAVFLTLGGSEALTGKCTYFVRAVEGKVSQRCPDAIAAFVSAPRGRGEGTLPREHASHTWPASQARLSSDVLRSAAAVSQVNSANVENDINFGTLEGSSLVVLSRILSEVSSHGR